MSTAELTFKYQDLQATGQSFDTILPLEVAQRALEKLVDQSGYWVDQPPSVSGTLYKTSTGEVICDCKLHCEARFKCVVCSTSRCLSMDYRGDLIIVPESHDAANEPELYGEGEFTSSPDVYTFEGTDIDLTEVIRELLILEAPVHPRCEHAQQSCVEQEKEELPEAAKIHPQWAPLLAMREALKREKEETSKKN